MKTIVFIIWCVIPTSSNIIFEILDRVEPSKTSWLSQTSDKCLNLYWQDIHDSYGKYQESHTADIKLSACNTAELIYMIGHQCIEFVPVDGNNSIAIQVPIKPHEILREWIFWPSNTTGIGNININIKSSNIILRGLVTYDYLNTYRKTGFKIYSNWKELHFCSSKGYSFTELGKTLHIDSVTQFHSGFYEYIIEDLILSDITPHVFKLDVRTSSN